MQAVFQFFGYGPEVFHALVGVDRPLLVDAGLSPTPVFGHVELARELAERVGSPSELCSCGWGTWLLLDRSLPVEGRPLAWIRLEGGERRPILTCSAASPFHFWWDVDNTLAFMQNERALTHTPPGYVKLGITPDRAPAWARKAAIHGLHWLRGFRRRREWRSPHEPADFAVDNWRTLIQSIVAGHTSEAGVPLWPAGKKYAVLLTHDLDSDYALRRPRALNSLREVGEDLGLHSAWLVVTRLLDAGMAALDDLHAAGHEIGCHGMRHDHRLAFLPEKRLAERIRKASMLIDRYGTTGFRSPNFLRTPALFRALDKLFEYDMSMLELTSDPTNPLAGKTGCSTCLPFLINATDLLEIPTTVPLDCHYELLGLDAEKALRCQLDVIAGIRARCGVANILAHPEPYFSLRKPWLVAYRRLVEHVAADPNAWVARPRDLNRHWRARQDAIDACWSGSEKSRPVAPKASRPSKAARDQTVATSGTPG